jgi:hypothetical protein
MKSRHHLASPPAVTPGLTYWPSRPISGASRLVSLASPAIFVCHHRQQQRFEVEGICGVTDLYSIDRERGNTIYVSSGPSGPILTFFIQFEFYPIKRSRFEKISSPMFLEFDLVFYIIFLDSFYFFFKIFEFEFQNSPNSKFGLARIHRIW